MTRLLAALILSGVLQSVNLGFLETTAGHGLSQVKNVSASALQADTTFDDTSEAVKLSSGWQVFQSIANAFNGTLTRSTASGSTATFVFTGNQINVHYAVEPKAGKMQVIVDGKVVKTIDQNASKLRTGKVWQSGQLSPGEHTLVLKHRQGTKVNFDRLDVVNNSTVPQQPTAAPQEPTAVPQQPTAAPQEPTAVPQQPTAVPQQPTAVPQQPTSEPASGYIFNADFESGDLSSFSGSAGEYFGKGVFFEHKVVNSPAIGKNAAALTIGSGANTAAYLFTYKVPSTSTGTYSADFYIPGNVVPDSWWNVWQWKSRNNTYDKAIFNLNIVRINGVLQLRMSYNPGGSSSNPTQFITQSNPIPFPTDRWANITGHFTAKSDNTGSVVIYQDGVKILEKSGVMTKPGNEDVFWSINSYADQISPNPATIYVDNMRIRDGQSSTAPQQPPTAPQQPTAVPQQPTTVPQQPTAAPQQPTAVPPQPTTSAPAVNTIFNADFESGDLSYFSGSTGEYFGKGVYFQHKVVNSPAIGKYSAALTIGSGSTTAAYLFTYKVPSTPLAVYNADYYIPGNIVPDSWWNVWQWKSRDTTYSKPIFNLNIVKVNGVLQLRMSYNPGGSSSNPTEYILQSNPVPFPTDRWVNITGYYTAKYDNTGSVVIYQDGVKILEKSGILTKPGNKDVFWSINSYADRISPDPATIYVDNMRITEVR